MQININDTPENWLKWGKLVRGWVFSAATRPADTAAMQAQMDAAGVVGSVPGQPGPPRPVKFVQFNYGADDWIFPLPAKEMVIEDEAELAKIAAHPPGQRQYPLPSFYAIAFGGAPMVDVEPSNNAMLDFGTRRLGEYTILECQ
jgi:hypothetical protein